MDAALVRFHWLDQLSEVVVAEKIGVGRNQAVKRRVELGLPANPRGGVKGPRRGLFGPEAQALMRAAWPNPAVSYDEMAAQTGATREQVKHWGERNRMGRKAGAERRGISARAGR